MLIEIRIVRISDKASITVTYYNELIVTTIDKK